MGSLLGGDVISITGVTFNENDNITCKFGKSVVEGHFITEDQAMCVSPPAPVESVVDFSVEVKKNNGVITGGTRYHYGNV